MLPCTHAAAAVSGQVLSSGHSESGPRRASETGAADLEISQTRTKEVAVGTKTRLGTFCAF